MTKQTACTVVDTGRRYREMFNHRQLLGLELSCRIVAGIEDEKIRNALVINLSELLQYQNMLCRYDTAGLEKRSTQKILGEKGLEIAMLRDLTKKKE